jgi:hypothetical protein
MELYSSARYAEAVNKFLFNGYARNAVLSSFDTRGDGVDHGDFNFEGSFRGEVKQKELNTGALVVTSAPVQHYSSASYAGAVSVWFTGTSYGLPFLLVIWIAAVAALIGVTAGFSYLTFNLLSSN